MSTAQHEAAAQHEEQLAAEHEQQYNPSAGRERVRCSNPRGGPAIDVGAGVCWTSVVNPTEQHLRQAEAHRRHAADHRAGSEALQTAEAQACAGIPPVDRDMSPFEHTEDILMVEPLRTGNPHVKIPSTTLKGAVVTFRAVPQMTPQWLQRLVDCHLARNASLGHVVPEMPNCPLVPKNVSARVSSTRNGFAVAIESDDEATASEILARANRLVSHGSR